MRPTIYRDRHDGRTVYWQYSYGRRQVIPLSRVMLMLRQGFQLIEVR